MSERTENQNKIAKIKKQQQSKLLLLSFCSVFDFFKLPKPTPEYKFHSLRRWRFDFAYPENKIAFEIEGGVYTFGAHTRGKHYESDCEKYNTAAVQGWRVFRFTNRLIHNGHLHTIVKELSNEIKS